MSDFDGLDILVEDGEIVLDDAANPVLIHGADSLAQDIKHLILERGYAAALIAQRDQAKIEDALTKLIIEIENDNRVTAGSVDAVFDNQKIIVTAQYKNEFITVEQ